MSLVIWNFLMFIFKKVLKFWKNLWLEFHVWLFWNVRVLDKSVFQCTVTFWVRLCNFEVAKNSFLATIFTTNTFAPTTHAHLKYTIYRWQFNIVISIDLPHCFNSLRLYYDYEQDSDIHFYQFKHYIPKIPASPPTTCYHPQTTTPSPYIMSF